MEAQVETESALEPLEAMDTVSIVRVERIRRLSKAHFNELTSKKIDDKNDEINKAGYTPLDYHGRTKCQTE